MKYYMSDKQIVDRLNTVWQEQKDNLHSHQRNEQAVRAIATAAWDCAVLRRRPRFRWWPW